MEFQIVYGFRRLGEFSEVILIERIVFVSNKYIIS